MLERFDNADISVMKGNIFADQCDRYFVDRRTECLDHRLPVSQIRFRTWELQAFAGYLSQMLFFHRKRRFV